MLKKILYTTMLYIFYIWNTFAEPDIWCWGLPFCKEDQTGLDWAKNIDVNKVAWNFVSELIQYVAVIAVISLMISGIMYLVSGWEEEKVKKAKTWIIWSLVWVFLSVSAFAIISIVNEISIW